MKNNILEKIGFAPEENIVYMSLLQGGPASASDIIRKTDLHRPAAYKVLGQLIGKGLVSVMPHGKGKLYVAESPEKIERIFESIEDNFNSEIHELHDLYKNRDKKKPIVSYAEGGQAILAVSSDVVHSLKKGDTYYRYSPMLAIDQRKYLPKDYKAVRDRKGLERLIITNETSKKNASMRLGRSMKAVPAEFDLFGFNISQIIYGDKVAFVDYNTKTTITIENPMIAEFQKKIFKLLFKKL